MNIVNFGNISNPKRSEFFSLIVMNEKKMRIYFQWTLHKKDSLSNGCWGGFVTVWIIGFVLHLLGVRKLHQQKKAKIGV